MRTWERVAYRQKCGRCGVQMTKGTAALKISLPAMKRSLWRCADCEGPAPELPELLEHESVTDRMTRIQELNELAVSEREWTPYRD